MERKTNILFNKISSRKSAVQLIRYALIGISVNLTAYCIYLLLTYLGCTPKLTMSILYGVIAFISFLANRKLTFSHKGNVLGAGFRYVIAHCFGYVINLIMLVVLVDMFGYPHQVVQLIAILTVAAFLFVLFKFFVFREPSIEVNKSLL